MSDMPAAPASNPVTRFLTDAPNCPVSERLARLTSEFRDMLRAGKAAINAQRSIPALVSHNTMLVTEAKPTWVVYTTQHDGMPALAIRGLAIKPLLGVPNGSIWTKERAAEMATGWNNDPRTMDCPVKLMRMREVQDLWVSELEELINALENR